MKTIQTPIHCPPGTESENQIYRPSILGELEGLLRGLFRDLDASLVPFQLAIAAADRKKATSLQAHIEFISAAMLVLYEKKQLAMLSIAKR
ncbi:hypothetical protein [Janthinobacterium sp. LB2P70]|uniref:hypothetical protein n=1 Tax=Janthinobacterium sp. LB2P70 TaxID=3424197 RepID=UPI003F237D6A